MKVSIIKQPYELTMARHHFNIHEMRIVMKIIERLQPKMVYNKFPYDLVKDDIPSEILKIPAKELITHNSKNYDVIRKALKGLTKKSLTIKVCNQKGDCAEIYTNFLKEGKFAFRDNLVTLEISGTLLPAFLGLAKGYTKYSVPLAFNFSRTNTVKIYQWVCHWKDRKTVFLPIDLIRSWLNLEDKYPTPTKIKKWVISPAQKELQERADVWFKIFSAVKEGRKMIGWKLQIYSSPKEEQKNLLMKSTPKLDQLGYSLINSFSLAKKQSKKIITSIIAGKVTCKQITSALYDIQVRNVNKQIQNIGAYTLKVIKEKFDLKI